MGKIHFHRMGIHTPFPRVSRIEPVGSTALFRAAVANKAEAVEKLVEKGADTDIKVLLILCCVFVSQIKIIFIIF